MCQVINFKAHGSTAVLDKQYGANWLYIGRANSQAGLPASPLANPFKVANCGGRGGTLPHYRRWLWERIQAGDRAVPEALDNVGPETALVCWCKPGPCHGDVVLAAAAWRQAQRAPVFFVSGHRDLTEAEFARHYQPALAAAVDAGGRFVVGDAPGADRFAQAYLQQRGVQAVAVYHAGRQPRVNLGFAIRGGYTSQTAKDRAMTQASSVDIAWVRPDKNSSGTARNLARRRAS